MPWLFMLVVGCAVQAGDPSSPAYCDGENPVTGKVYSPAECARITDLASRCDTNPLVPGTPRNRVWAATTKERADQQGTDPMAASRNALVELRARTLLARDVVRRLKDGQLQSTGDPDVAAAYKPHYLALYQDMAGTCLEECHTIHEHACPKGIGCLDATCVDICDNDGSVADVDDAADAGVRPCRE